MCCFDTIVPVHGLPGFFIFLLNLILPGFGTMLSSCMGKNGMVCTQFCVSLLQLLLAVVLIGWIWSIWWGCLIWGKQK